MQNIKKEICNIQNQIKQLKFDLTKNNIDMVIFLEEIVECLSFISGYTEKSLEKEAEEQEERK